MFYGLYKVGAFGQLVKVEEAKLFWRVYDDTGDIIADGKMSNAIFSPEQGAAMLQVIFDKAMPGYTLSFPLSPDDTYVFLQEHTFGI